MMIIIIVVQNAMNLSRIIDLEISLFVWPLGGYVGLYDAQGFKFDTVSFQSKFIHGHEMARYFNIVKIQNVWNATDLVLSNED